VVELVETEPASVVESAPVVELVETVPAPVVELVETQQDDRRAWPWN